MKVATSHYRRLAEAHRPGRVERFIQRAMLAKLASMDFRLTHNKNEPADYDWLRDAADLAKQAQAKGV